MPVAERSALFMSNRWVNTIYTGYGIVKQRIFLQIIQELQEQIKAVRYGHHVSRFKFWKGDNDLTLALDMSTISHYNNYHQVREAVREMSEHTIEIYFDPQHKQRIYRAAALLNGYTTDPNDKCIIQLRIKRSIAELLLHVDYSNGRAKHYTQFDRQTVDNAVRSSIYSSTKYMWPLYTMICSYAAKGGFHITLEELRQRLQVEDKYNGFDNFHRFILQHVQKELQIFGKWGYNFSLVKKGKKVTAIQFKVFANNTAFNKDHTWLKIQRALKQDLPYFMRFSPLQQEQFNYLLTSTHDLQAVHDKLLYIHSFIIKKRDKGQPVPDIFAYTHKAITGDFPP